MLTEYCETTYHNVLLSYLENIHLSTCNALKSKKIDFCTKPQQKMFVLL